MRERPRLVPLALAASGVLLAGTPARAELEARLDYARPPEAADCAEAAGFERAVSERLGKNPFRPDAARTFEVRILADSERLIGFLTLTDAQGMPEGLRRFEGTPGRCDELVSALALALSLVINPELAVEQAAPAPLPAPAPAARPPAPETRSATQAERPPAPSSPTSDRAPPRRSDGARAWNFAAGAGAHAAIGTGPEPTVGVGVLGRARGGELSLGVEGRFDAPMDHAVGEDVVYSRFLGGALVPCYHLGPAFGCAVGLLGAISAGSEGVAAGETDSGVFFGAGGRLGAGLRLLERLTLEARLEALATVTPVSIELNRAEVWRSPAGSASFGLMAVAGLP